MRLSMRNSQNPSVILSDDSSPFKGAEIAVAPTELCNAIAGNSSVTARLYPPNLYCRSIFSNKFY